jgi:hypothetical protein
VKIHYKKEYRTTSMGNDLPEVIVTIEITDNELEHIRCNDTRTYDKLLDTIQKLCDDISFPKSRNS